MIGKLLILAAAAAFVTGCAGPYKVHVNAYSELGEPLNHAAPIYIVTDPNSKNPILRRQIATKIHVLLQGEDYNLVDSIDKATYALTFEAGTSSNQVLDYMPIYRPFGYYGYYGRPFGYGFGYSTYVPFVETVYTYWLRMRLYAVKDAEKGVPLSDRQVVWVGEALYGTDSPEFRKVVDYMLIADTQYLGADTREWVTVSIPRDDPRLLGITGQ